MHLIRHLVHGLAASLFLLAVALLAQEPSRPTFLFPTAAPAEPAGEDPFDSIFKIFNTK